MYFQDDIQLVVLMDDKMSDAAGMADGLGVYLFKGGFGGEDYGIFVDVSSVGLAARSKLSENNILSNVIELKHNKQHSYA